MRTTWYGWNFFGTLSLVIYLVKVITDYSVHNSLYQLYVDYLLLCLFRF